MVLLFHKKMFFCGMSEILSFDPGLIGYIKLSLSHAFSKNFTRWWRVDSLPNNVSNKTKSKTKLNAVKMINIYLWWFILVTSIFSLSHSVFKSCLPQACEPFPKQSLVLRVCSTSLLKTWWEKEQLLITSSFSFSHSVFYPFWRTFCHFYQTWNCRLQTPSVWKSLKFVVWERVKSQGYLPKTKVLILLVFRCNSNF